MYVPVDLTIPTKLGSSGFDSLDFLSRLTARTIFSAVGKDVNSPARSAREIQTIPTINWPHSLDSVCLKEESLSQLS